MRPEGWKPLPYNYNEMARQGGYSEHDITSAFEAGADAMLEGLRKEAFWIIDGSHKIEIDGVRCFSNGKLIFIPEEPDGVEQS